MQLKRVVVTGLGALTPLGNSVQDYWNGLIQGISGADLITKFDASKFKTRFACEVKNFDPNNYFDRKEGRKLDGFSQYALVVADQAVASAVGASAGVSAASMTGVSATVAGAASTSAAAGVISISFSIVTTPPRRGTPSG